MQITAYVEKGNVDEMREIIENLSLTLSTRPLRKGEEDCRVFVSGDVNDLNRLADYELIKKDRLFLEPRT
jgi:hypothetical protein